MRGPDLPLHVEEHGSGGRPLVLIHGFGGHAYTWRHWIPRLRDRFRVLAVDLKGHGAAPKPADDAYGPEDQAELLVHEIRRRGLERATLVGHSLGGGIALLTALRLAERGGRTLESLVLISAAAFADRLPRFVAWARSPLLGPALVRLVPPRTLVRWILRSIVHDPSTVTERQVRAYAEPLASPEGRRAILRTARRIVPADAESTVARYPRISRPALLLWGRQDRVVPPAQGERLARALPRAKLEVLEACGHIPQEERPDESLAVVEPFLQRATT